MLLMLLLHYVKMLYSINNPNPLVRAVFQHFAETQLVFHIVYVALAAMNVRIIRQEAYWNISRTKYMGLLVYHLIALVFTYNKSVATSYFMAHYIHLFWKLHCDSLAASNAALLRALNN